MQWFASLACAEEGCRRFEIIVITLPCIAWPAGVAHPDEQSLAVFRVCLIHRTITFIVFPLCQTGEVVGRLRFAEHTFDDCHERSASLSACLCEIMLSPGVAGFPFYRFCECAACAFRRHHVRHATLGMQFSALLGEVGTWRFRPIRSVSAHSIISRR